MPEFASRPFTEGIEYFNDKAPLPTNGWQDVYGPQHDRAFMVAGANKIAIVEDFATAIQVAMENGETLEEFRGRFDDIVTRHGWDYKGSRGWRSRLIYETNIRQSYNAGRERQMNDPAYRERFPYMEYRHSGAENFRPLHKKWNNLVLRADDPWWQVHSPSNGYGCKCKKFPRSSRWMRRQGRSVDQAPEDEFREFLDERTGEVKQIPLGIDPGFEHRPGASLLRPFATRHRADLPEHVQPVPVNTSTKPTMPEPAPTTPDLLLDDAQPLDDYLNTFLEEFGVDGPTLFRDITGEPVALDRIMFEGADGAISIDESLRPYIRLLARTLQQPDEVWTLLEPDIKDAKRLRVKRRYLKRWQQDGRTGFTLFDQGQGIWTGRAVMDSDDALEQLREGVLLYHRTEDGS